MLINIYKTINTKVVVRNLLITVNKKKYYMNYR